jgi:cell division protein FtsZ
MNVIEFTPDGPFAEKSDPLFPSRVRILGLGQTGAAVCDQIVLHGFGTGHDLWVYDTDEQTIGSSIVANRELLGRTLVHGLGCSGDLDLAREVMVVEEQRLSEIAHGCDFLILVLGFGGATGVALAEHLVELGHRSGTKVIIVGVQPFSFEGWTRREKAIAAIATLRREADSVLVLSHDRLPQPAGTERSIRHSFHLMHQLLAQAAQALTQVVCKRGLIQLSFADVRSLYGRYVGSEALENCWVAHVESDVHERTEDLVAQLLAGPLLTDEMVWKHADHALVIVSGTRDLGLADMQELVSVLKESLPATISIATSASLDEADHDKVRLMVLFAMTAAFAAAQADPAEAPVKKSASAKTSQLPAAALPASAPTVVPAPRARAKAKPDPEPVSAPAPQPIAPQPKLVPVVAPTTPAPAPLRLHEAELRLSSAKQAEMEFEGAPRGRFEKAQETIYRGENLDQPTFRRRRLAIRL